MEIGIRKMAGGTRRQLLIQFLIENYIVCFLALLVGIAGATILVPAYGSMWEYMNLTLSFSQYPGFWIFLLLLLLFAGFVAGAWVLAGWPGILLMLVSIPPIVRIVRRSTTRPLVPSKKEVPS